MIKLRQLFSMDRRQNCQLLENRFSPTKLDRSTQQQIHMVYLSPKTHHPNVSAFLAICTVRTRLSPLLVTRGEETMNRTQRPWRNPITRILTMAAVLLMLLGFAGYTTRTAHASGNTCQLKSAKGNIKHVIYIQFDNTHFTRDNPNVPSDLEQMPHLLNFIESNGVLLSNHHTPLISHTATDILTSLTGVYGDRMGVPVSNSFRYFNPDGTSNLGVSFACWTHPIFDPTTPSPTDTKYNITTAE